MSIIWIIFCRRDITIYKEHSSLFSWFYIFYNSYIIIHLLILLYILGSSETPNNLYYELYLSSVTFVYKFNCQNEFWTLFFQKIKCEMAIINDDLIDYLIEQHKTIIPVYCEHIFHEWLSCSWWNNDQIIIDIWNYTVSCSWMVIYP